jgi:hypothetical protein
VALDGQPIGRYYRGLVSACTLPSVREMPPSDSGVAALVKPVLQALLLADQVYQDKASGKCIVAGIFGVLFKIRTNQQETQTNAGLRRIQPHESRRSGSPSCYVSLTSVRGTLPLELRYVDLADNSVLMSLCFEVSNADPIATVELIVPVPSLPTPHAGDYALELLTDNELIGSHRIRVLEKTIEQDSPKEE